jgi:small subunit ribosomal protein S16
LTYLKFIATILPMLKMRLQRVGRKHEPSFRLVLTDSKNSTKSGRFKEILGSFDPRKSTESFNIERVKHWLSKGIKPTDSVHNLFVTHKILDSKKKNVLPRKTPIVKEEEPAKEAPAAETSNAAPAEEKAPEPAVETTPEPVAEAPVEAPTEEKAPEVSPEAPAEEVVQ